MEPSVLHGGFQWLWADAAIIKVLFLLLFVVVPFIVKMLKEVGKAKPPGGGFQAPPRPMAGPQRPPVQQAPPGDAGVNPEIEEFLRRAAQRRSAQQGQAPQPKRPAQRPPQARPAKPPPLPSAPPARQELTPADVVSEVEAPRVASHVAEHLDNREFQQRTSKLTNVDKEADDIKQHVHDVFDHQLGSLTKKATGQTLVPAEAVTQAEAVHPVAALLGNSQNIRQAVILNEILTRPIDRWDL
jgi:hypothetical protein